MDSLSRALKKKAGELGFDLFGIARSEYLGDDAVRFNDWLNRGHHAGMDYMTRNSEKRMNPGLLVSEARSIIVVGLNYYQDYSPGNDSPLFSRYALGLDYHMVMKEKLHHLNYFLKETGAEGKVFVDSAPVKENIWANRAGLGWIGKNSLLINSEKGSYLFLGGIITSAELEYNNTPTADHCGSCRKCVEACPTNAIQENRTLNAAKCISYLTIEHRGDFLGYPGIKLEKRVFGCDVCQEVCPWNRKPEISTIKEFRPLPEILEYTFEQWNRVDENQFRSIFTNSPVERSGFDGFKRNLSHLMKG